MIILVGFTHSNRSLGYSSFDDGWRPEARQTVIPLQIPETTQATPEQLAEAVFAATNTPGGIAWPGVVEIRQAITRWTGGPTPGWRSVSTGDTVTVGTITYACTAEGWRKVIPTIAPEQAGLVQLTDTIHRPYPSARSVLYRRHDTTGQLVLLEIRNSDGHPLWRWTTDRSAVLDVAAVELLLARALVTTSGAGRSLSLNLVEVTAGG